MEFGSGGSVKGVWFGAGEFASGGSVRGIWFGAGEFGSECSVPGVLVRVGNNRRRVCGKERWHGG